MLYARWGGRKKMKKNVLLFLYLLCLSGFAFSEDYSLKSLNFILTKEVNDIFSIGVTLETPKNSNTISMYHGKIVDLNRNDDNPTNLGKYVEVVSKFDYYFEGAMKSVDAHMIYSNLTSIPENVNIGDEITTQKTIGIAGEKSSPLMNTNDVMISMYTLHKEFYLEYYTSNYSEHVSGLYWYSIVNVLYRRIPNPNIFNYEEIDIQNTNFEELSINKAVRFRYVLTDYPKIQDPDYLKLYISAVLSGLIPDYQNLNYSFVGYIKNSQNKIMLLWPEKLVERYKEKELQGKEIYLFVRKVAQNESGILFVTDLSSDISPEEFVNK